MWNLLNFLAVFSLLTAVTCQTVDLSCVSNYACNVKGPNLLGYYNISQDALATSVQERIEMCQLQCQSTPECRHFTWYDSRGVFPHTCYLYSACESRAGDCVGCHSGPKHCVDPEYRDCRAIETDFGGTWFCFPEISSLYSPVAHGSRCIFQCPEHVTYHVCNDGMWSAPPGEKRCLCPAIGSQRNIDRDGRIVCWPPRSLDEPAHAGTYCIHACHGHPKEEFKCHHGRWTTDADALTCSADGDGLFDGYDGVTVDDDYYYDDDGAAGDGGMEQKLLEQARLGGQKEARMEAERMREKSDAGDTGDAGDAVGYELVIEETGQKTSFSGTFRAGKKDEANLPMGEGTPGQPIEDSQERPTHADLAPMHDEHSDARQNPPPLPPPHPKPLPNDKNEHLLHIGYKLLQHPDTMYHVQTSTSRVPYTMTTVKPHSLPMSNGIQHTPYPVQHHYPTTHKTYSYQTFNSAHTQYGHGQDHENGVYFNKTSQPYQQVQQGHHKLSHPVRLDYGTPSNPRHYSYKVTSPQRKQNPNMARMDGHDGLSPSTSRSDPMPQIHHFSGGTDPRGHITSPPHAGFVTTQNTPTENAIMPDVHHHSTPPPTAVPGRRQPPFAAASNVATRRTTPDAYPTTRPTPRAPTRPTHFSNTYNLEHSDPTATTTTTTTAKTPVPTAKPKQQKQDPEKSPHPPVQTPVRHTLPTANIHHRPEQIRQKIKYKLLKPDDFFAKAAERIYLEAAKKSSQQHAVTAHPNPKQFPSTKTSSTTSVEEVIESQPQRTGGKFSYKLLKPPIPSAESKLKPGEISNLPLRPTTVITAESVVGGSNPFLLKKHSYSDYSVYDSRNVMVHTNLGIQPGYAVPAAAQVASTTMGYGVLYKEAADTVQFKSAKEEEVAETSTVGQDSYVVEARNKKAATSTTTEQPKAKNPFLSGKKKFIGFSKNEIKFPSDEERVRKKEEEEEKLLELVRKKHGDEMKKKKKKIVFTKKRNNKAIAENSPLWKNDVSSDREESNENESRFPNFPAGQKLGNLDHHVKKCPHLAQVPHGQLKCGGNFTEDARGHKWFEHGSTCVLTCDPGYASDGEETSVCGSGGAWMSNSRLECQESVALLIGGWSHEKGLLADVEVHDPREGSKCGMVQLPPLPEPRRGAVAGWVGGRVVVCGGVNSTESASSCFTFNAGLDEWEETGSAHGAERHFASAAKIGDRLYVLGGRSGGDQPMALGTVESLDGSGAGPRMEEDLRMTQERAYHCAAAAGDEAVVVTGGYSYNAVVGMAEVFNATARAWSKMGRGGGNLLQPRYLHACAAVPTADSAVPSILVAGGYSTKYLRSAELFDPRRGMWESVGEMNHPRQGGAIAVLGGGRHVVALGGFHSMTEFPAETERFDVKTRRWKLTGQRIKTARRYFALAEVPRSLLGC